jgi:hypothetical protein
MENHLGGINVHSHVGIGLPAATPVNIRWIGPGTYAFFLHGLHSLTYFTRLIGMIGTVIVIKLSNSLSGIAMCLAAIISIKTCILLHDVFYPQRTSGKWPVERCYTHSIVSIGQLAELTTALEGTLSQWFDCLLLLIRTQTGLWA